MAHKRTARPATPAAFAEALERAGRDAARSVVPVPLVALWSLLGFGAAAVTTLLLGRL